jgi:MFS family permease
MFAFFTPWGFAVLGLIAGIVIIAQMTVLAGVQEHQGIVMGLFSTTSYLGMSILPFIAGLIADTTGFFIAFCITAFSALLVAVTVGRSPVPVSER